jgi:hypothetical protein
VRVVNAFERFKDETVLIWSRQNNVILPQLFSTLFRRLDQCSINKIFDLMQLKKLAVLGNVCFWLTLVFQYGKWARNIQQDLLNTIVMLGLLAIVLNLGWIASLFVKKNGAAANSVEKNSVRKINQAALPLFTWFNILSFASQLIFLFFKFL